MKKRGQGYSLNWIFVVFAGVIILSFFIFFGVRYTGMKTHQENAEIASAINDLIYGLSSTTQYNSVEMPWEFTLRRTSCDKFKINEDFEKSFEDKIIFWPDKIESKELLVWTKEFKKPFFVANLIYLVDPTKDYYIVGNTHIDVPFDNVHQVSSYNGEGVIVYVEPDKIRFEEGEEIVNLGDEIVLAALFSENFHNYNCVSTKLMEKHEIVKKVYYQKTFDLQGCDYTLIKQILTKDVVEDTLEAFSSNLEAANYDLWQQGCEVVF